MSAPVGRTAERRRRPLSFYERSSAGSMLDIRRDRLPNQGRFNVAPVMVSLPGFPHEERAMKRHPGLFIAVAAVMVAVAAFADKKPEKLLILDWAAKSGDPAPPAAVLIELGLKDKIPTPWAGTATVSGARLVRRDGYRFWKKDELVEPDGW